MACATGCGMCAEDLLPEILADHFHEETSDIKRLDVDTGLAIFDRLRKTPGLTRVPGTAELLDWVTALTHVYQREYVHIQMQRFSDLLRQKAVNLPWWDLPGLSCLVKLREDTEKLYQAVV